jgi:lipid-A-disaccharide synthase
MANKTFMLIAGEASGDLLASELVSALREKSPGAVFFGAGGSKMSASGVELVQDMSYFAVVGITDVIAKIFALHRLLKRLLALAIERKPDVIIGVDYGGFNLRFGHAIRQYVRKHPEANWNPKIVQFISPQVWASRPGRANRLAADYDLLLSIFPFEKAWYAQRVPQLRVEFIGHPMVDRFLAENESHPLPPSASGQRILLLPGSRRSELKHHLPTMLGTLEAIRETIPLLHAKLVVPNESLAQLAKKLGATMEIQIGNLPDALRETDVAIAKTGTVTMECAFLRVPTVTLYKGSWLNYQIARRLITVSTFAMPNLLAGEEVYPEFLQYALTVDNLSRATLDLLQNEAHRNKIRAQLDQVIASLGPPGAIRRAAATILSL